MRLLAHLSSLCGRIVISVAAMLTGIGPAFANTGELLDPTDAFRLSVRGLDAHTAEVEFRIAPGYYLYRDRFSFETESGLKVAEAELPTGKIKEDQFFGRVQTYRDHVRIKVPLTEANLAERKFRLEVNSQGCADIGVCYVPQEQWVDVQLAGVGVFDAGSRAALETTKRWASARLSMLDPAAASGMLLLGFALAWVGAGAPSRPWRGVQRRVAQPTRLRPRIARVLAFTASGAIAGALGESLAQVLPNPWINAALSLYFIGIAVLWWARSAAAPQWLERHSVSMTLAGVLPAIAYAGDAVTGAAGMLAFGAAAVVLPRARARTSGIQHAAMELAAVALFGVALWVASPLLMDVLRMLGWAGLLMVASVVLRATDVLPNDAAAALRLGKAIGVILLVCGVAVLVGAASGARDPLRPFEVLRGGGGAPAQGIAPKFEHVATLKALETRIAAAGRPVMLDFYADWCVSCKEMEAFTFSDPAVAQRMAQMLLLQVDVTRNSTEDRAILKRFKLFGPPGIIFFDASGRELENGRVIGFQPAEEFVRSLDAVLAGGRPR